MLSKPCRRFFLCATLILLFSFPFQFDLDLSLATNEFSVSLPALQAAGVSELWDEYLLKAKPKDANGKSASAGETVAQEMPPLDEETPPLADEMPAVAEEMPPVATIADDEKGEQISFPGRCVGKSAELSAFAKNSDWPYRRQSYELYYDSSRELARAIYSLALQQKDISPDMPLERFEKGVQGFHYSTEQIIVWAQKIVFSPSSVRTKEEQQLFDWLVEDGIIVVKDGSVRIFGLVGHVLGAAPGKKRSFIQNLRHERLHVYWDEQPQFAENARKAWAGLDAKAKKEVYSRLKGYSSENEAQLIEEWAVFESENLPEAERKTLVGI